MRTRFRHLLLASLTIGALTSCVSAPTESAWVEPRPLGAQLEPSGGSTDADPFDQDSPPLVEPVGELTLRDVLTLAIQHNPQLASTAWSVREAEALRLQAGLLPNPEFEVEAENFGGSGDSSGFDAAEITISLSQLIELGGKRAARSRVAWVESRLAGWDHETQRLAVWLDATMSFIGVLAAQERHTLAGEMRAVAEETLDAAAQRVRAGKVTPLEETRAAVELANRRIDEEQARRDLRAARLRLAATWGGTSVTFDRVAGALDRIATIPPREAIAALYDRNPDVARWTEEMELRLATLALERAQPVPDLVVGGGLRYARETSDQLYVMGIALPVPIFDRNQGGILAARHALARASQEKSAAEVGARLALGESYEALAAAHSEATALGDQVLPGARKTFEAIRKGYQQGKFGYLEVLDAQRTLFEAEGRYLDALATYHLSVSVVESLIGTSFESLRDDPATEQEDRNHGDQ